MSTAELKKIIAKRLQAVQAELRLTDDQMSDLTGLSQRTVWANWRRAHTMPAEEAMVRLCEKTHLTLDWIYRGISDGVPASRAIRLEARLRGMDPDAADAGVLLLRPVSAEEAHSSPAPGLASRGRPAKAKQTNVP